MAPRRREAPRPGARIAARTDQRPVACLAPVLGRPGERRSAHCGRAAACRSTISVRGPTRCWRPNGARPRPQHWRTPHLGRHAAAGAVGDEELAARPKATRDRVGVLVRDRTRPERHRARAVEATGRRRRTARRTRYRPLDQPRGSGSRRWRAAPRGPAAIAGRGRDRGRRTRAVRRDAARAPASSGRAVEPSESPSRTRGMQIVRSGASGARSSATRPRPKHDRRRRAPIGSRARSTRRARRRRPLASRVSCR